MQFISGKQDLCTRHRAQENGFLLTNGLGGYASVTNAFSVPRCDQGILVAAVQAPNERITMVHRLSEMLTVGERSVYLSTQDFMDGTPSEEGYRHLSSFSYEFTPQWTYQVSGVRVIRQCAMAYGENEVAVLYTIENRSQVPCTLRATPYFKFAPKEEPLNVPDAFSYADGVVSGRGRKLWVTSDGSLEACAPQWQTLSYPEDAKDGRPDRGMVGACCVVTKMVAPGQTERLELVFSLKRPTGSGWQTLARQQQRLKELADRCGLTDPVAKQLAVSADAFIAHRDSTNGKTILAGYPLFSDWGRDTMIALPGCTLATGRFDDAKSILRTFLAYEKDGLVPNLFPEGTAQPRYNTVDAALLLIDCVWQYVERSGDRSFVAEAWPVLERIISAYRRGTHHHIGMDTDGLIYAGDGLDQVTWMDVCVNGFLPTPRHGKPVEINAYWYNALKIMEGFAAELGLDGSDYGRLANQVRESFLRAFYQETQGYLKDVISGTKADAQIRCNQIWAVSMGHCMLNEEQQRRVVDTVYRHLYTPCGLRTLSPEDPEYHPHYGGDMVRRDMAYHQGTTWVFPMGAYYLAYLKVHGYSEAAKTRVREELQALVPMLRQGCQGQLPEIYDGDHPTEGKGCFAQAWSVGEMLRVFEALEDAV